VTNAETLTKRYQYVPSTGARGELSDVNQLLTKWSIDGFGRVLDESRSDGNETRSFLKVCDINLCYAYNGDATYTARRYDTRGRLTSTSEPAYASNGAPALASSQEYDDLNRVTAVTVVDAAGANQTTRTEYKGPGICV
jgi:hypothetical protein